MNDGVVVDVNGGLIDYSLLFQILNLLKDFKNFVVVKVRAMHERCDLIDDGLAVNELV